MKRFKYLLLMACTCFSVSGYAQDANTPQGTISANDEAKSCCTDGSCCENNQTPIGIMTAHIHDKGKWMVSYTYMNMGMQGNRLGTEKESNDVIYKNYLMSPDKMTMQMHMVMVMYGVTDRLTLMGMAGFANNNMTMITNQVLSCCPPGSNTMQSWSSGLSDTKLYALYSLVHKSDNNLIGSLGLSLPTGSATTTGVTVLGYNERLSYNMQLGTGSFGLLPAVTYLKKGSVLSWGAEAGADVKLDNNAEGYKCGNIYNATAWLSHGFFSFFSASVRAEAISADRITGTDPAIAIPYNLKGDPTASAANSGGQWVNVYVGANFHLNKPVVHNFQLSLEYGMPVYQDLNGTQMSQRDNFLAGLQYRF